jgi:hypothetical protein
VLNHISGSRGGAGGYGAAGANGGAGANSTHTNATTGSARGFFARLGLYQTATGGAGGGSSGGTAAAGGNAYLNLAFDDTDAQLSYINVLSRAQGGAGGYGNGGSAGASGGAASAQVNVAGVRRLGALFRTVSGAISYGGAGGNSTICRGSPRAMRSRPPRRS